MAPIKKYHKFNDLKECSFILLHFRGQKSDTGCTGLKSRIQQSRGSLEDLGKTPFPCLFQPVEASCIPWLMAPSSLFTSAG